MVNFKKNRGSSYIGDFGDKPELAERIENMFNQCANEEDLDIHAGDIFVFGSYARGVARKGDSDIDVMVTILADIDGPLKEFTSPVATIRVGRCLSERGDRIIRGFGDWFSDIDIIPVRHDKRWPELYRKSRETRTEGRTQNPGVYDLWEQQFIDQDTLLRRAKEDGFRPPEVR